MNDDDLVRIAHALSDPTRLGILRVVAGGRDEDCCSPRDDCCPEGVCVCDLEAKVGLGQSKISYHLRELKDAALVSETRSGRWNYYTVRSDRVREYAEAVAAVGRDQFAALVAPGRRG
ncbi:Bacterial regulatory protein, ArsR domain protein [mine drainage metagenome]|uniref:Bacterial regulatory protein, ArsR domain protein n=2 Tax=mine drainage metagenome TaxID=410659 RepID=T1CB28_9ZZZZ